MDIQNKAIEDIETYIKQTVHHEYYAYDTNCATTTLLCLSKIFDIALEDQLLAAALGMHGAGGYRAQCGLVEGGLMFIGIFGKMHQLSKEKIVSLCYQYGEKFEKEFGSLRCRELRPQGFNPDDAPHMCEGLTCRAIIFTYMYVKENILEY